MKNYCEFCHLPYTPNPKTPHQKYCKRAKCIKKRKRYWQQNKRATDKDYKSNQADAYESWSKEHPDYWKNYRENHPDYVKKNREKQKQRNAKSKMIKNLPDFVKNEIAKMEKVKDQKSLSSGYYVLVPFRNEKIAKVEKLIVKLDILSKT